MSSFEHAMGVTQTGPHTYRSNEFLTKPHPKSRGVYGGNLAGQALLVAVRSAPQGFTPHSLHLYFVKAAVDNLHVDWAVTENSNGKTFCNRTIKALQDGVLRYVVHVSLTKRNLVKEAEQAHREWAERERVRQETGEEDDDDETGMVAKPFTFQTPLPLWLRDVPKEKMHYVDMGRDRYLFHLIPHQMISLEDTKMEDQLLVPDRKMSFYVRLGDGEMRLQDPAFQFVGIGVLSDSLFLTRLARILRISTVNLAQVLHYFSLSLDHVMYFHDTDFDCTKWVGFGFRALRIKNNRVLLEGEMFNEAGLHVATIVQEGLVHFNGLEKMVHL